MTVVAHPIIFGWLVALFMSTSHLLGVPLTQQMADEAARFAIKEVIKDPLELRPKIQQAIKKRISTRQGKNSRPKVRSSLSVSR